MDERKCKYCGAILVRRERNGKIESARDFSRRQFCNKSHSTKFQHTGPDPGVEVKVKEATKDLKSKDKEKRLTAAEYLMDVINDEDVNTVTRVTAASKLLPYQEKKAEEKMGKKEAQKKSAQEVGKNRFAPMQRPTLLKSGNKGE